MLSIWNYITIGSAIVLSILVLVQTRGASLGAGLGGGGEVNTVRRGTDKTIMNLTIIIAIVFSGSLLIGLLTA
ncbi:preprotein translocase subunit SecG [bacterium]|jgi:preprotein translocase subunit SecG|nr:preprotein translocase subunit SecG [bacterium]NBX98583.1 preprotein translocase subunit SecG [bacterium]NDC94476.1 preprotein translocase subunit SecG [bacterium]NDD84056.1 preprotein translocase subunit SecG [bacterium]NDG29530.1 preprotein translocase subunit SecG [bacterium]